MVENPNRKVEKLLPEERLGGNGLFARVTVFPGREIDYHEHHGESERARVLGLEIIGHMRFFALGMMAAQQCGQRFSQPDKTNAKSAMFDRFFDPVIISQLVTVQIQALPH